MSLPNRMAHSIWDCKYHVVWIPKYRRKRLYGEVASDLGKIFHRLASQRESKIIEGHVCKDHVHMLIEIPPKYAVSEVVGYVKGKSAIYVARTYLGKRQNFTGQSFWARGYFVSTVGKDEEAIKQYIQEQEAEDRRLDQLEEFKQDS